MESILYRVGRGTFFGALVGTGLGLLSAMTLQSSDPQQEDPLIYKHERTGKVMTFETCDDTAHAYTLQLLRRVRQLLFIYPRTRPEALAHFEHILYHLHRYYKVLFLYHTMMSQKGHGTRGTRGTSIRVKLRTFGTRACQALSDFEPFVWDHPDLEPIARATEEVRQSIMETLLVQNR